MKTLIYGGRLIDPANRVDGRLNLLIGIFVGSMVLCSGALLAGLNETFYSFIHTFESDSNTIVLASFLLIGALIYLIEKSGGIDGFTEVMLKKRALIKSKRGANLFTWLLGIIIFTSGSLSCMVTGSISRPFNDALKVPHEKSAFIIHATSTPWCVLFPLSGWLAAMTGYLTSGGVAEGGAISVLLKSIPLNFYCILAVFGTLAVCLFNINIGPMRKAEERAEKTGELDEPGHGGALSDAADKVSDAKPRVINMVLPMCVLIVTILATLTVTGNGNPTQGAGMQSLLWGCVLAVLTICILCVAQKLYTVEGVINEMFKGMGTMLPMAAVLLFGFTMGSLVKSLDTGNYLTAVFMGVLTQAAADAELPAVHAPVLCDRNLYGHDGDNVRHLPADGNKHGRQYRARCRRYLRRLHLRRPLFPDIRHHNNVLRHLRLRHHRPCKDPDPIRCDMRRCVDRTVHGARLCNVRLKNCTYYFRRKYFCGSFSFVPTCRFEVLDLPRL